MKIQCPSCQHEGTVPDDKVASAGATVGCPKCNNKFQITPPSNSITKLEPDLFCPKCGTGQPTSETCINCGIVFSKFINRQTSKKTLDVEQLPPNKLGNNTISVTENSDASLQTDSNIRDKKTNPIKLILYIVLMVSLIMLLSLLYYFYFNAIDVNKVINDREAKILARRAIAEKVSIENYFVKKSIEGIGNTTTSILDDNMVIKISKHSPVKKESRGIQRKIYPLIISGEAKGKVKIMYNIFDDPSTFGYECYDNIKFNNILLHAYKDEVGRYDYYVVEKGDVELGAIRECSSTD